MRAGPSNERGESSSSLSTTVSSSRHTGTRSAVRTPPATTTSPSTHASRRSAAPRSTHAPSAAPAASANPTDGRYNVRSATNTPAGYNRFATGNNATRSEEHTSELQSPCNLVCRLLLEKKKKKSTNNEVN